MARGSLTQDFAAHELFAFAPVPERPWWRNRAARVSRWWNIGVSQSWLAVFLFRFRVRALAAGVPVVPDICDVKSRALFRVQIGRRVSIGPGLMVPHGNVVIDGATSIGRDCQINPWVTIGLSNSRRIGFSVKGPTIGDHVHIGTGAKILGPITVGDYARIGANAVVLTDVPANATVVGAPARVVATSAAAHSANGRADSGDAQQLLAAIVDYKLHRCSLTTLADRLSSLQTGELAGQLETLRRASQAGESAPTAVSNAIDEIDAVLRSRLASSLEA
jgi:serine O-acetyltransferase